MSGVRKEHVCRNFGTHKNCELCKQDLPLSAFGKNRAKKDGLFGACRKCRAEWDRQDKAEHPNRCRDCNGERAPGRARCYKCLDKLRNKYHSRIQNGLCERCGKPAVTRLFCMKHWFAKIGTAYGLTWKNGGVSMLMQLWQEQGGRCAVTDTVLVPGDGASLDHIIPLSRGGGSSKGNLRWVLLDVNKAKMDMTHREFVELCRKVVSIEDSRIEKNSARGRTERSN